MKRALRFLVRFFPFALVYYLIFTAAPDLAPLRLAYSWFFGLLGCKSVGHIGLTEINCGFCSFYLVDDCTGLKELLFVFFLWLAWPGRKKLRRLIMAEFLIIAANLLRLFVICLWPWLHPVLSTLFFVYTIVMGFYAVGGLSKLFKGGKAQKYGGRGKRPPRKGRKFPPRSRKGEQKRKP